MSVPLFDELWDYNDPAATRERFLALLPEAAETKQGSYYMQLLTQIARTHGLQRDFEQAHRVLDEAESLVDDTIGRIRYLLERGRTFNSSKQKEKAIPLFEQAWELAGAVSADFYAIDAAHMLGIAAPTTDEQLAWNLKAMAEAEATDNTRAKQWLGSLYNNIGWTYHDAGDFETALATFEKAHAWYANGDKVANERIARWCIGRTLRSLNRLDEALAIQQQLLAEYTAEGADSGYTSEEMGECLLALGRTDEAHPHFAEAFRTLSQDGWLQANEPERLSRLQSLAQSTT